MNNKLNMRTFLNKIVVILMFVGLGMVSCSDFLKEDPRGRLTEDKAFTSKDDLNGSLYALNRQVLMATKGFINFTPWMQGDDLSTHPASNKAPMREFDIMTVSDENTQLTLSTGSWYWLWKVIKAANFCINWGDNALDLGATEDEVNFVKRQAYYWRAYAYFYLVRVWGPVPMVLDDDADLNAEVSKVSEIFDLIVADLKEAEKLPENYKDSPWAMNGINVAVSKGAAQASLAYVYLYMAGWPLEYGANYYKLAADKALEVIDASENGTYYYKLYDEYRLIHSRQENWSNKEVLLAVYYSSITGTGDDSQSARGCINDVHDVSGGGYNDACGDIYFYCLFPEGDRKEWTYAPVTYNDATDISLPWWSAELNDNVRSPYSRKSAFTSWNYTDEYDHYKSFRSQSNGWSLQAHQVIRLAEVYCWYAEAVGRQGLVNARAVELLNRVRNRANGSASATRDIYSAGMSANELAEAAYNEHGWEIALWYWGSIAPRYSDMQRMNRVKDHYNRRRDDQLQDRKYIIPGSGGVELRELFGPVEPWTDEKMFVTYPSRDKEQMPNIANVDKLNLIK